MKYVCRVYPEDYAVDAWDKDEAYWLMYCEKCAHAGIDGCLGPIREKQL